MPEIFNRNDYKLEKNGLNYECSFNDEQVIFGEFEENPHGVNNEIRIDIKEFVDAATPNAINFSSHIKNAFGQEKLKRLIIFLKNHSL
ncbi:MAG: hypothetical protein SFY56_14130 [Bacteroidota bacterium]|nr:hypothetical protein [Bacteroidota bacterium]